MSSATVPGTYPSTLTNGDTSDGHPNDVNGQNDTDTLESVGSLFANTNYARQVRAIHALRDLGLENLELGITLPKVAVIGNQSAGKSSLIEAISQVRVPRSAGACTKCPMELRLEGPEGTWSCRVSLRFHPREGVNSPNRTVLFHTPASLDELEIALQWAQLAILNPGRPHTDFLDFNAPLPSTTEITFSKDTIVVEISGAKIDLTFVDLPGIITNEVAV